MNDPNQPPLTAIRVWVIDGSYYDAILPLTWDVLMHTLITQNFLATSDFFINRAQILKLQRLQMDTAGKVEQPPAPVIRPTFGVVGGKDANLIQDGAPTPTAFVPTEGAVNEKAMELYERYRSQTSAFTPAWPDLSDQMRDYWKDQAVNALQPKPI